MDSFGCSLGFWQVKSSGVSVHGRFKTICPVIVKLSHVNQIFGTETIALRQVES